MAIDSYATLQTAIGNWLDHSLFTARIPEFITLFEAAANRRLRVVQQETAASLTTVNGAVALPADYLMWRQVVWFGDPRQELEYVTPSYQTLLYPVTLTPGRPQTFTISQSILAVRPIDDTAVTALIYYQKIPALSDSATTNWLLAAHPDLYLFGSLVESEMFGVNDERAGVWKARCDEIFDEIQKLSNKTRGAGAIRVAGITP